ncbi:hypothetical protein ACQKP8_15595 [Photobacterium alginatilyticum]|uniref:hypothetical protein n=1 Tax=Photobacterium alginatilyticum TaxID=1775171 RepID=UPI0040679348
MSVFLDNKFALWSTDSSRLTLLFDPGRVKTGLVAHNAMGRALIPGEDYQLVIDPILEDVAGNRITGLFDQPSLAAESAGQEQWISIPIVPEY